MLTLHLASEWKKYGIRVNAIAFHGFKNHVSAETAVSTIKTCIENRGITEEILIVSDEKTEIYQDWKYRIS
jgi:NAD(P)-dependent dehydrogenase (short-subunit alcohol dehydrogenase family)